MSPVVRCRRIHRSDCALHGCVSHAVASSGFRLLCMYISSLLALVLSAPVMRWCCSCNARHAPAFARSCNDLLRGAAARLPSAFQLYQSTHTSPALGHAFVLSCHHPCGATCSCVRYAPRSLLMQPAWCNWLAWHAMRVSSGGLHGFLGHAYTSRSVRLCSHARQVLHVAPRSSAPARRRCLPP